MYIRAVNLLKNLLINRNFFLKLIPPNINVFKYMFILQQFHIQSSNMNKQHKDSIFFYISLIASFFMFEGKHQYYRCLYKIVVPLNI